MLGSAGGSEIYLLSLHKQTSSRSQVEDDVNLRSPQNVEPTMKTPPGNKCMHFGCSCAGLRGLMDKTETALGARAQVQTLGLSVPNSLICLKHGRQASAPSLRMNTSAVRGVGVRDAVASATPCSLSRQMHVYCKRVFRTCGARELLELLEPA